MSVITDKVWIGSTYNLQQQVTLASSLIATLYISLQHVLSRLRPLFLHQPFSGNGFQCRATRKFHGHSFATSPSVAYGTAAQLPS
jgi:hypothetical protein